MHLSLLDRLEFLDRFLRVDLDVEPPLDALRVGQDGGDAVVQPPGDRVGVPRDDGVAVDDGTVVIVVFFTLALLLLLGVSALLRILRLKSLGNDKE